jgi:hypothetical protein
VIVVSPHVEPSQARIESSENPAGQKGVFETGKEQGSALGVFARILAGLTAKTGGEGEKGLVSAEEVPPEGKRSVNSALSLLKPKTEKAPGKSPGVPRTFSGLPEDEAPPVLPGLFPDTGIQPEQAPVPDIPPLRGPEGTETESPLVFFEEASPAGQSGEHTAPVVVTPPYPYTADPAGETVYPDAAAPAGGDPVRSGGEFRVLSASGGEGEGAAYVSLSFDPGIRGIGGKEGSEVKDAAGPRTDKSSGARGRDRKRERPVFEVTDLRAPEDTVRESPVRGGQGSDVFSRTVDITVEPGDRDPAGEPGVRNAGRSFETLLAREIEQNLSADIVREARFILRDGGEGTIRLSLKPESLGNVKIRLEMADNKITGHIIVESEEVLRAFEKEALSLERTFLESGFDGAVLDFSLAQGEGGAENHGREMEMSAGTGIAEAASRYDAALEKEAGPVEAGLFLKDGRIQVNMLV